MQTLLAANGWKPARWDHHRESCEKVLDEDGYFDRLLKITKRNTIHGQTRLVQMVSLVDLTQLTGDRTRSLTRLIKPCR